MATADEIRRLREETSIFSRLFDLARQQGERLEQEGRRPVLGGLLSKEPVMGTDTIRYEGITPLLLNLIEPIARGIDAPRAAYQGLIPQEDMIGEAFGTASTAMIGGGLAAKPSDALGANTLRSKVSLDVAERGDQILNMLKSGRADDITDSMLDMRDPVKNTQLNQYLFENYDLPMDEASRMARAREMGFDVDNVFYHGTDADFLSASADMGAVDRYKTGFYSSDNPNIAETYAPRDGGKIIPVLTRNDPDMIIDAKGSNWNQLEFDLPAYSSQMGDEDLYSYFFNMFADNDMQPLNTNAIARERRFEGDSSVMFENLVDRGGVYPYGDTSLANVPSNIRTDFYPSSLRSKFARFDPRLRNNENLLAANASPISGILAQSGVSENQAQRIKDYLRKRGLLD